MLLGLSLVVTGSVAHAVWNLLVKRSAVSGAPFVWLYSALVTPVLVVALLLRTASDGSTPWSYWWAAIISAALHTAYALVLQRSYTNADIGVVYPIARAGGPILIALGAVRCSTQLPDFPSGSVWRSSPSASPCCWEADRVGLQR